MYYPKLNQSGNASDFSYPTSKVVCVGRNYREHAKELNNPIPSEPLLFIKSTNTLVDIEKPIVLPQGQGSCHHELELALLIGQRLDSSNQDSLNRDGLSAVSGIGLALDLTLRELQSQLKNKGHPWERAKSFDGACPISQFLSLDQIDEIENIQFSMTNNNRIVQQGTSQQMIFGFKSLLQSITACFTLYPGDIVLTGTPQGVAELSSGDHLSFEIANSLHIETTVE